MIPACTASVRTFAGSVGQRHGEPVVFRIEALRMHCNGFKVFLADSGVWPTVLRHLNEAMDQVRKAEYKRLTNRSDRTYIKRQKYALLSHRANLSPDKRRALTTLLAANKRLNTAYILKEQFGQLWTYRRERWARKFFDAWRTSLKWQRLKPFERLAAFIERHWDGISAYCEPENKVALGFVEGLNNTIRVIQRRCCGLRDEDYLRLTILTCTLPPLPKS